MKLLAILSVMALALPVSAAERAEGGGPGGKCDLSVQTMQKHIGSDSLINSLQHGRYVDYDANKRTLITGKVQCEENYFWANRPDGSVDCWASSRERAEFKVMGTSDCGIKYTEIALDENVLFPDADIHWLRNGATVTPAEAKQGVLFFQLEAQKICDTLNKKDSVGQSKIKIMDYSTVNKRAIINTVKSVTLDVKAVCVIED